MLYENRAARVVDTWRLQGHFAWSGGNPPEENSSALSNRVRGLTLSNQGHFVNAKSGDALKACYKLLGKMMRRMPWNKGDVWEDDGQDVLEQGDVWEDDGEDVLKLEGCLGG